MQTRRIGIPGIDRATWGEHICVFFYSKAELLRLTIPYIKAGLEDGEFCMWITGEPVNEVEAFQALEQVLPNAADYLLQKQLEIIPHSQWYVSAGVFDANLVLHNWVSKARYAEAKDFAGIRITGNPFWLRTEQDWSQFGEYEKAVTNAIRDEHVIALCTYPGYICQRDDVHRVLSVHRSTLFPRNDLWQHLLLTRQ
jgi:hypothetical protein